MRARREPGSLSGRGRQHRHLAAAKATNRNAGRRPHGRRGRRPGGLELRRALGKRELRVVAVDDGPFTRRQRWAPLAAVAVIAPGRVEGVALGRARVDGSDATVRIAELVRATGQLEGARAVLLDGISVAGFNVVDLERLAGRLGLPVVAVTPRAPDLPSIHAALTTYFRSDRGRRWRRVRAARTFRVPLPGGPLYAAVSGAPRSAVALLLARVQGRGRWPEALTVAHRIARAVSRSGAAKAPPRRKNPYAQGRRRATGPVA
jgi:endonuclease V-like protein UPF0215 family